MSKDNILWSGNPAAFKGHLLLTIIGFLLIVVYGLGLIILLGLFYTKKKTYLEITKDRIKLRKGLLAKSTNEIPLASITNIQTSQGVIDRLFNIGDLAISSSATAGQEMELKDFPELENIKQIISENAK